MAAMSDIPTKTYPPECLHAMIADHEAEQAGATSEASSAVETKGDTMSDIERLIAGAALNEIERLQAEGDQTATHPKGREVGRFGLDGHYLDYEALKPTRPTDEDIWREAFMTLLPSYPWEKAAEHADRALAEYRKRWPR